MTEYSGEELLKLQKERIEQLESKIEELKTEKANISPVQNTFNKSRVVNVTHGLPQQLAGRSGDLNTLKQNVQDLRDSQVQTPGHKVYDLKDSEAYRQPEDGDQDYYSRVRWLKAGNKKKQLLKKNRDNTA